MSRDMTEDAEWGYVTVTPEQLAQIERADEEELVMVPRELVEWAVSASAHFTWTIEDGVWECRHCGAQGTDRLTDGMAHTDNCNYAKLKAAMGEKPVEPEP